jgi:cob(I)alamin adenosyltransferase
VPKDGITVVNLLSEKRVWISSENTVCLGILGGVNPYTKTGDDGTTGDLSGARVSKASARMDAIGAVDELGAVVGWALVVANRRGRVRRQLVATQRDLFVVGAMLASPCGGECGGVVLSEKRITEMESVMDRVLAHLPEQRKMIVAGGCELASRLHVARTVCRRAERRIVAMREANELMAQPERIARYINRLGDLLFVLARLANKQAGIDDVPMDIS